MSRASERRALNELAHKYGLSIIFHSTRKYKWELRGDDQHQGSIHFMTRTMMGVYLFERASGKITYDVMMSHLRARKTYEM